MFAAGCFVEKTISTIHHTLKGHQLTGNSSNVNERVQETRQVFVASVVRNWQIDPILRISENAVWQNQSTCCFMVKPIVKHDAEITLHVIQATCTVQDHFIRSSKSKQFRFHRRQRGKGKGSRGEVGMGVVRGGEGSNE